MTTDRSAGQRPQRPERERTLAIDKSVFAHRLWQAIKRSGLTYRETARLAQAHLPTGQRMSDVSVWSYAKGRSLPRKMVQVEALAQVLGVEAADLFEETEPMRRPGAQREAGARVADLGDGRARLQIDLDTPWPIALEVLRLLKVERDVPAAGAIETPDDAAST